MVACLILYQPEITSLTKIRILRMMFHEYDFKIHVLNNNTVLIFISNLEKKQAWQAAILFESSNIITGYGFSSSKEEAEREAWKVILQLGKAHKQKAYQEKKRTP